MSYRDLPPGRARMLAYADEIDTRFRSRISTTEAVASVLRDINTTRWSNVSNIVFGSVRPRNRQWTMSPLQEYEILSELPDVKVGLVSKNLLDKSKVENSCDVSFCAICQHDIFLDIIRKLDCGHSYHIKCIDTWFTENKKCPQCRYEIN
jgi:hypothetical protein